MSDLEKAHTDHHEVSQVKSIESDSSERQWDAAIARFSPEEQKRIIRRIDVRLVLTLGFLYCVSLMDRTNTGIVVVAGMGVDMYLIGNRYSVFTLVFFVTYVLLQPPATVVLRKLGPKLFLPSITLLWGIVTIGMGFARNWTHLIPMRLLLGIFEAGFFPGCAYLLSCWYPRYELQKRNAVFYLIGSMASAFSGILSYGFSQLAGKGAGYVGLGKHTPTKAAPKWPFSIGPGLAGWRWIFILQGVLTCIIALISYVTIVDFPEHAHKKSIMKFMTKEESDFIVARIEKDRKDVVAEPFKIGAYLKNGLDIKVWGFACLFGLTTTVTYAIAFFLPIILQDGMKFSVAASQCLIAPPYVLAAIVMFTFAWLGDKYHIRSPFILANAVLMLIGLALLGFVENVGARYFGVFLATTGANANVPCVLTWQANNIRGQWKRALCSATLVAFGGIGGIIGSLVFRSQDKPTYRPGIYTTMTAAALIIVITCAMNLKFYRANQRAAAGGKWIEKLEGFRYTL